jgi:hypothetical protein
MTGAYHLETDASLNLARTQRTTDGRVLSFAGGGAVIRTAYMAPVATCSAELGFVAGPTHAEFDVLVRGVNAARARHGATALRFRSDNLSIVRAVRGEIAFHDPTLASWLEVLRRELAPLERYALLWSPSAHGVDRADGQPTADALARAAAGLGPRSVRRRGREW